jgi:quinohemoprotein ethanol dehydrogenase
MKTGRPVETGQGDYSKTPKMVFPGAGGAHNWQPMSYSSSTGLVYIPVMESPAIFTMPKAPFDYQRGGDNQGSVYIYPVPGSWGFGREWAKDLLPPIEQLAKGQPDYTVRGALRAWDPVNGKVAWEVDTSGPWKGQIFSTWNGGGVMSTAGNLVFQGRGTGQLAVLDARTGKSVANIDVGSGMMAAPMSYLIDGKQYVAIMTGVGGARGQTYAPESAAYKYGNKGRIVVFKIGGGKVPHPALVTRDAQDLPPLAARIGDAAKIKRGGVLFQRNCALCHTNNGASGSIPDLRRMSAKTHAEFFDIVLKGIRSDKGMGNFGDILSRKDAEAIHAHLIDLAWADHEARPRRPKVH